MKSGFILCCLVLFKYTECLLKVNIFIAPAKPAAKKAPAKVPAKKEESSSEEESSEEESSDEEEEKAGSLIFKKC